MYTEWDRYGEEEAFAEDHPEYIKKIGDEAVAKALKTVWKTLKNKRVSPVVIQTCKKMLAGAK